jgi:MFS family permease
VTVNVLNFLLLAKLFQATGSSIATSLLWVSYALPTIFFGPIGASIVDVFDRRNILILTNLLQALTIFIYIFSHGYSIFLLFAVVVIYSFFNQFYVPAESATLPSIVNKDDLPQANSLFFLTQQISLVVGFGFAGIIQSFVGFKGSLIICTISLFLAFLSVYFLPKQSVKKRIPGDFEDAIKMLFKNVLEGYHFIKENKFILYPLLLLFVMQVALAIVTTNLPQIASQILKTSVDYVGLVIVVPAGLGATLASVVIPKLFKNEWRKKKIIMISLFIISLATLGLVFGRVLTSAILVFFIGLGFVGINIPTLTYLQEATPKDLRGRVFGNLWFFTTIATIFPVIFSGVFVEFFGLRSLLTILALSAILILVYSIKKGNKLIQDNF